jgi:hypothetical protein
MRMKKNILRLVPLIVLSVFLQSCRTNEDYVSSKDESYYSNKFQVFTQPDKNGKIDYPSGFAFLFMEYDRINRSDFTGLKISENKKGNIAGKHVDFSMSSHPIRLSNGAIWVYFPVVENGNVTDVIAGILRDEETYVEFGTLNQGEEYNQMVLQRFRSAYLTRPALSYYRGKDDPPCGGSAGDPCDIEEIDIPPPTGPRQPTFDVGTYPGQGGATGGGNTQPPGGGCSMYNNCGNPPEPKNPCEKAKDLMNNDKTKPAIDALKTKSMEGGENGYKIKADGTPSDVILGGDHSVNFGDKTGYVGGYHNHTPTGIPMFSPNDIDQLLQFALAQGNYGTPSNAYIGMVATNGMHYVMYFNGNYNDALVTFSQANLDTFNNWYRRQEAELSDSEISGTTYINADGKINTNGVEKLFFDTLKKMGLEGKASLQRIENDNTVKNVTLNSDGKTSTATPCPQI